MKWNAEISIYKETMDWKQEPTTTLVGVFKVWLQQSKVEKYVHVDGKGFELIVGAGLVILWDSVDLTNCFFNLNGMRYDFITHDIFVDARRNFHHIEAIYK